MRLIWLGMPAIIMRLKNKKADFVIDTRSCKPYLLFGAALLQVLWYPAPSLKLNYVAGLLLVFYHPTPEVLFLKRRVARIVLLRSTRSQIILPRLVLHIRQFL